jgi:cysteine sulfinate desulfinase/cysteine desulfurase-like protein
MAFSPSGVITGGAQSGFTSPTYTITADTAPEFAKQWTVTAVGGTQTGVLVHSIGNPFTFMMSRDRVLKSLGAANPVTGVISPVPRNIYRMNVRKGILPYTDAPALPAIARLEFSIPAGGDFTDPENVRALVSLLAGLLSNQSSGIGDLLINGSL